MATTTTSKAKTKTTKARTTKPKTVVKKASAVKAVKTTKASTAKVATKAVKKPVVKSAKTTKPVKKSDTKVTIRTTQGRFSFLSRGFVQLAALFAILAGLAGYFMNTSSVQMYLGHLAKDQLASNAGTVLVAANHMLYEVEYRWLLVGFLAVSAILAVLRATVYRQQELSATTVRVNRNRWIDFAITGSLAYAIVALLNGMQDTLAVKFAVLSIVVAATASWLYERENAVTGKPSRTHYYLAVAATAVPVLGLLATMLGTYLYGMERSAWYAYVAAAIVIIWLLVTVRTPYRAAKALNAVQQYPSVNRRYDVVATVAKIALAVVLIVGLYAR